MLQKSRWCSVKHEIAIGMYNYSIVVSFVHSAGVAFTEYSKPQFCPELKLEIDEFLTTSSGPESSGLHSDCTLPPAVPPSRTVGAAGDISRHLTRKEIISCKLYEMRLFMQEWKVFILPLLCNILCKFQANINIMSCMV